MLSVLTNCVGQYVDHRFREGRALATACYEVRILGAAFSVAVDDELAPELKQLLEERWAGRDGLFVFHRGGHRINSFRKVWTRACKKAGLEGRLVHDLRRTAARDFRRRGVSEGEIMKLCGWKTRAMFDRYNIIDEADLAEAVAKRFTVQQRQTKGQTTANIGTPTTPPSPLSSSAA